jgi:hypothetical protein
MQGEAGEGEEMEPDQGDRESLVVACQAAEARGPDEITLHHPTLG